MIKADFTPNKRLATNKGNAQHNEIKTRMQVAQKTKALHLNQLNIIQILPDNSPGLNGDIQVFKLKNLVRLDLSFNNIVKLSPRIGELTDLQQLWLNDNPLREIPIETSKCSKLKVGYALLTTLRLQELDLKNTFLITLPREVANLSCLLHLNLDGCPLKESLSQTYQAGMVSIHKDLRRKEDRKVYKEKLFEQLTEWIYPSQQKEEVFDKIEQIYNVLKDCNTEMLKKLQRNVQMLFPVKFDDIDPMIIREKLFKLYDESIAREDIAQIQLRLKSHFLDEPLEVVVKLSTDLFHNIKDQNTIDEFFRYKSHTFNAPLHTLNAQKLLQNLADYKAFKRQERIEMIEYLKTQIDNLYADEKIKEEKLRDYTDGLVKELKRTSFIVEFAKTLRRYMPKYNELKHFNAHNVAAGFFADQGASLSTTKGSNTMTFY